MNTRRYCTRGVLAAAFGIAAVVVVGAVAWLGQAVLALEHEQYAAEADADFHRQIDLAMWRLDNLVAPVRAAEAARPLEHYNAFYSPSTALDAAGSRLPPNSVLEPSPLLTAELPDWLQLHFHVTVQSGWSSPQVIPESARHWAERSGIRPRNERQRRAHLGELAREIPPEQLIEQLGGGRQVPGELAHYLRPVDQRISNLLQPAWQRDAEREQAARQNQQLVVNQWMVEAPAPSANRLESFFCPSELHRNTAIVGCDVCVDALPTLPPMLPVWLSGSGAVRRLAFVRPIPIHGGLEVQGVLLDWPKLRAVLLAEVSDLFPAAALEPDPNPAQREPAKMWNLPVTLEAGAPAVAAVSGWTSLRVGLAFTSAAALLALAAVGWGGWTLLELSERRQQFVSAVTHELRTPLTTLRLYLDMLANGMVRDERQRDAYLKTLCAESDRLSSLISDVLDFARIENGRAEPAIRAVAMASFMHEIHEMLEPRCRAAGKSLLVECSSDPRGTMHSDPEWLLQIVSNLVDNACKHSAGSADRRVWVRAALVDLGKLRIEVEDGGPGVPSFERRAIFRSFWRGAAARASASPGAGLGLALADRWARLLGGSLALDDSSRAGGARFVVVVPSRGPVARDACAEDRSSDETAACDVVSDRIACDPERVG